MNLLRSIIRIYAYGFFAFLVLSALLIYLAQ